MPACQPWPRWYWCATAYISCLVVLQRLAGVGSDTGPAPSEWTVGILRLFSADKLLPWTGSVTPYTRHGHVIMGCVCTKICIYVQCKSQVSTSSMLLCR